MSVRSPKTIGLIPATVAIEKIGTEEDSEEDEPGYVFEMLQFGRRFCFTNVVNTAVLRRRPTPPASFCSFEQLFFHFSRF